MADADKPAEKDLVGIEGWLAIYVLLEILFILFTVVGVFNPPDSGGWHYFSADFLIWITEAIAVVIGLHLIFYVRKPITRTYHIWLNFIWAGFWRLMPCYSGCRRYWCRHLCF